MMSFSAETKSNFSLVHLQRGHLLCEIHTRTKRTLSRSLLRLIYVFWSWLYVLEIYPNYGKIHRPWHKTFPVSQTTNITYSSATVCLWSCKWWAGGWNPLPKACGWWICNLLKRQHVQDCFFSQQAIMIERPSIMIYGIWLECKWQPGFVQL